MNYCKMLIVVSDIEDGYILYFPPKYSLNYGVHLDCFNNSYHYYESASEKYPEIPNPNESSIICPLN